MSGADEKIRAVLERVARRVAIHIYLQITDDAIAQVEGELERELLPLLLAGQAKFAKHYECEDCYFSCPLAEEFCGGLTTEPKCKCGKADWDVALAAAQGQPEKESI